MVKVRFRGIEIDRCTDCKGIWFDRSEKDDLLEMRGSQKIDIGDAKLGREFNRIDCILCPRCGSHTIRMVALDQPHIHFEHCTVCGGCFLDAGEFRDLKRHTIVDIFKDMFARNRGARDQFA
jgi:Zn-finger nucleic acid-binding protein